MIMAYVISNPQFNIWNISYITSYSAIIAFFLAIYIVDKIR